MHKPWLGGGVAPLQVAQISESAGSAGAGWFMSGMALISLLTTLALPETRDRDLAAV